MAYKYSYLDIVSADVTIDAEADTLEELFIACAKACFEVMTDIKKIKPRKKEQFDLDNERIDYLLVDFLSEMIFMKDTEGVIFSDFKVKIIKDDLGVYKLDAAASGSVIDYKKSKYKTDVKAVTYHQLCVEQNPKTKKWRAQVVLDV